MATKVASLYAEISADTSKLEAGLNKTKTQLSGTKSSINKMGTAFQELTGMSIGAASGIAMAGFALQKAADFTRQAITAASNLNETMSKTKVIFGAAADSIIQGSDDMAESFGMSQQAFLDAASTFGVFGKSAGLTGQELTTFSGNLAKLATDMASFSNTTTDEAIMALGAALRGETEPIRRYGVLLDDATLRSKALEMGIISTTKNALTPQQRVLAANALIFQQTSDAQGDFARTSDGLANKQRILKASVDNLSASIGQELLPAAIDATSALISLVGAVSSLKDAMKENAQNEWLPDVLPGLGKIKESIELYKAWKDGLIDLSHGFRIVKPSVGVLKDDINDYILTSKTALMTIGNLSYATNDLKLAQEGAAKSANDFRVKEEELASAAAFTEIGFENLAIAVGGQLGDEIDNFNDKQAEVTRRMGEVKGEIDKLIAQGYDPMGEKISGLQGELDNLGTEYSDNAAAHEEATRRILYGLAQQQLAMSGLDPSTQLLALQDLADKFGIVDTATEQANLAYQTLVGATNQENAKNLASAMDYIRGAAEDGTISVEDLQAALDILNGKKVYTQIYVDTYHTDYFTEAAQVPRIDPKTGKVMPIQNAIGMEGWVTAPTLMMVGERGDEYVSVIPKQEFNESNSRGGDTIWNVTIQASPGTDGGKVYKQFKQALEADMRASKRAGVPYSDF